MFGEYEIFSPILRFTLLRDDFMNRFLMDLRSIPYPYSLLESLGN